MKPLLFVFVFISYLSLWSFANWPALKEAWWSTDDYYLIEEVRSANLQSFPGLPTGRPISSIWFATFLLENNHNREIYNILLRFIQGVIHCSAATLAAILIYKNTDNWKAFLSILPFLLWPFNGEAVLWRAAGYYPLAALFGLVGVYLIWEINNRNYLRLVAGSLCIVFATLTNQVAAFSGLVVWIIMITIHVFNKRFTISWRKIFFYTTLIASFYFTSNLLSYLIANHFSSYTRAKFSTKFLEKCVYLLNLNYMFIFSSKFYPIWLPSLTILLFLTCLLAIFLRIYRIDYTIKTALLGFSLLISLFIIPYGPLLLVSENQTSSRLMYLAPFIITGVWIVSEQSIGKEKWANLFLITILLIIIMGYISISRASSLDYVKMFKADLRTIKYIEKYEPLPPEQKMQIFIATSPDFIRNWNPHKLTYLNGDSKISAFQKSWTAHPFIRLFSSLRTTDDDAIKHNCLLHCRETKNENELQAFELEDNKTLCICP